MNTAIKGLMCSRGFANFYLFILHFISWRIFPCKKIAFAKILVRHLRLCSVEKKVSFFIHLKFLGCTNFFLEMVMLDWLGEGLKLFERKKGRMESNTWQLIVCFEENVMERRWWKKESAVFGLRLVLVYQLEVLFSYFAVAWLVLFFWET